MAGFILTEGALAFLSQSGFPANFEHVSFHVTTVVDVTIQISATVLFFQAQIVDSQHIWFSVYFHGEFTEQYNFIDIRKQVIGPVWHNKERLLALILKRIIVTGKIKLLIQ